MRIAVCLALLSLAVSTHGEEAPLGMLRFRDYAVVMASDGSQTRYSVYDRDGRLLDTSLELDEVLARHPELHELLEGAVADGSLIWAGSATEVFDR